MGCWKVSKSAITVPAAVTAASPSPPLSLALSLSAEDIENVVGTIEAGAEFSFSFDLYGLLPGQHQLVAGLDSDKVEMVSGEAEVEVVEGLEETDAPIPPEEVQVVSVDLSLDVNRRVRVAGEGGGWRPVARCSGSLSAGASH